MMKKYFKNLPPGILRLIRLAGALAKKNHYRAYLVGGLVRDLLLGAKNLDLDIVVEGNGIKFARDLSRRLKAGLTSHYRFGTSRIILAKGFKIDIASARKEFYPKAAHLPEVSPGTLRDDLARRDFSINAMAISINADNFGRLLDFFGGIRDLQKEEINVLHDLSFIDDPTRILRAIRFEQRYGFKIGSKTLKLLNRANKLMMLKKIQPQRLRNELILILKEKYPFKSLKRLKDLCSFDFIHPHLALTQRTQNLFTSVAQEIVWFRKNFSQRRDLDAWLIYLVGFLDSLSTNEIKAVLKKFVFRKGEAKRILEYKRLAKKVNPALKQKDIKPSKVFALLEPLSYETIILLKARDKNSGIQRQIAQFFKKYNGMRICVKGKDLKQLGISPGPSYQHIFNRILKAKLDGMAKTKKEELGLAKEMIRCL